MTKRNRSIGATAIVIAIALTACGGQTDPGGQGQGPLSTTPSPESGGAEACSASPLSIVQYETSTELDDLMLRQWRRCGSVQARGEDVGVEFAGDGHWYALTQDGAGNVVRRQGIDFGGTWQYFPAGSNDPISGMPGGRPFLGLDGVITDPPIFTDDPRQMRIQFTPVQSRYVPLDL